jgi:hypothetical protein
MASARTFKVGPRALLAGDGGLLTSAVFAVTVGASLLWASGAGVGFAFTALAPLLAW